MFRLKQIRLLFLLASLTLAGSISATQAEVVIVVSATNPLVSVTSNQLADIFLGKLDKLPDGAIIAPVDQGESSREREEFYRRYLNRSLAQISAYWAKQVFTGKGEPPREFEKTDQLKRYIAAHPGSIGYLGRNKVDASLKIIIVDKP